MSPRPRVATDDQILMAAFRVIARVGPARLTLAEVAADVGVTPAALVQRFGSRRALLLAAAADAARGGEFIFPDVRARHRRPIDALVGLAECTSVMGTTPQAVANNLTFFQVNLEDAEFHRHARAAARGMRAGIAALVRDAIEAGDLVRCDPDRLAGAIHATINGSTLNWAVDRKGTLVAAVRQNLETLLAPYRPNRRLRRGEG